MSPQLTDADIARHDASVGKVLTDADIAARDNHQQGYLSQVGTGLWNTVKGLAQVGVETGGAVFDPLNAVEHLKNLKRMVLDPQVDQAIKAADEWKKGNRSESVGHALAAVLPGVGPAAANIGEKLGNQDYIGAAADATVLGGTMAAPHIAGAVADVAPRIAAGARVVGTGIKAAAPEVAAGSAIAGAGELVGHVVPGAEWATRLAGGQLMRSGVAKGLKAAREAMGPKEVPAAAAAAVAETPGMIFARESGTDWAALSPTDQAMMETIARANANAAAQPAARPPMGAPQARPEPTVTPGPAPRAPLFPDLPPRPRSPLFPDLPPPESGPPAAPAPEPAPSSPPAGGRPAAADVAAQLEASMRTEALTDYVVRKQIPAAMVEQFGPEEWRMIANEAGVKPPTLENIQAIRGNLAQYEGAANQPPEAGKMPPAEAQADFEQRRTTRNKRKPKAEAAPSAAPDIEGQLADSLAAVEKGERPVAQIADEGAPKPTASEVRVNAFAERLAAERDIPLENLDTIAQNPEALRYMDNLGRSMGIQGSLAPGDVAQIVDRVRQLRGAEGPPAPTTLRDLMQPEPPAAAAPRARRSKPVR